MSASRQHMFLITTLQETPTFYFRELGEIARIILIYTQTMSLTYIYQHCTTMSVDDIRGGYVHSTRYRSRLPVDKMCR